jgi:hypothetical protein
MMSDKVGTNPAKENRAQIPFALLICAIFIVPFLLVLISGAILKLPVPDVVMILIFSVGTMISMGYGLWNKSSQDLSGKLTVPLLFREGSGVWWSRDVTFSPITPIIDKTFLEQLIPKKAGMLQTEGEVDEEDRKAEEDAKKNIRNLVKKGLIPYKMIAKYGLEDMNIAGIIGIFPAPLKEVCVPITGNAFHRGLFVPASVSPLTMAALFDFNFPGLGRLPVAMVIDSDWHVKTAQSHARVANVTPEDVRATMSAFGASEAIRLRMENVTQAQEISDLRKALQHSEERIEKEVAAREKAMMDVDETEPSRLKIFSVKKFWLYFGLIVAIVIMGALLTKVAHVW